MCRLVLTFDRLNAGQKDEIETLKIALNGLLFENRYQNSIEGKFWVEPLQLYFGFSLISKPLLLNLQNFDQEYACYIGVGLSLIIMG